MSGKAYLAVLRVMLLILLALFMATNTHGKMMTALAFFYLGFALRPDINSAWRQFNQKLDAWIATPKGML
jgi:hypothetical protein